MHETLEPGVLTRRLLLRRALGASAAVVVVTRNAPPAAAEGGQVTIGNFTFSPSPLTVTVGARVTFLNQDDMPHSIVIPALKVRSHPLDTDATFTYTFDQAGTYDYFCGLHPFMHGQVVVQA